MVHMNTNTAAKALLSAQPYYVGRITLREDGTPVPCMCPLDCTCRSPFRNTVCGCSQHYDDGTPIPR